MGSLTARRRGHKFGVKRTDDSEDPHLAKQAALREAGHFGVLELLNSTGGGDPNAPTSPWGRDDSNGDDPVSARGNLWATRLATRPAWAASGFRASAKGAAAAATDASARGTIGTMWSRNGRDSAPATVTSAGVHKPQRPSPEGPTKVNGHIPAEVIQRIVRQNFGRFRLCYEDGLRTNPGLTGSRRGEVRHRPRR